MTDASSLVRIAGAGPAGLATAIGLAEAGWRVELHEARAQVGGRFAGDHQILPCFGEGPTGQELIEGMHLEDLETTPLRKARFLDGNGAWAEASSAEPYAIMIRRGPGPRTLDTALAVRAASVGVGIRTGSRLKPEVADVVASGAPTVDGAALELLFRTGATDRIDVLFDQGLTPGGYAYLFLRRGEGTLGVAALSGYKLLRPMLDVARDRFQAVEAFDVIEPRESGNLMNFALPRSARRGRQLYVGEAAGFQDYLFGLGIRSALVSGGLAARSLAKGLDYDALWKKALEGRMLVSAVDRYLYENAPGGSARLVERLADGDFRRQLNCLQANGFWKRLLLPWVRWRWRLGRGQACRHNLPGHWCRRSRSDVPRDRSIASAAGQGVASKVADEGHAG